jgi:hypothetical protein
MTGQSIFQSRWMASSTAMIATTTIATTTQNPITP